MIAFNSFEFLIFHLYFTKTFDKMMHACNML